MRRNCRGQLNIRTLAQKKRSKRKHEMRLRIKSISVTPVVTTTPEGEKKQSLLISIKGLFKRDIPRG